VKLTKITALIMMFFVLSGIVCYAERGFTAVDVLIDENNVMIISALCPVPGETVAAALYTPDGDRVYLNDILSGPDGEAVFRIPLTHKIKGDYKYRLNMNGYEIYEDTFFIDVSSEADFINFSIDGYPAKIKGDEITLTMNIKSLDGLVAEFKVSDKATVMVDGEIQISGESENDFEDDVVYTVIAEDGTRKEYTVSVSKKSKSSSTGGGGGGGKRSPSVMTDYTPQVTAKPEPVVPKAEEVSPFSDVEKTHWAYEYINALYQKGIVSGKDDGCFDPSGEIKREEFVKMLLGALGITADGVQIPFEDVDTSAWYASFVSKAYEKGIINGISETEFGIGSNVTREQMAVMIRRSLGDKKLSPVREFSEFKDWQNVSDYAKQSVRELYEAQLIDGTDSGNYEPHRSTTRAEASKLIYILMTMQ